MPIDKREELKGLLKEVVQDTLGTDLNDLKEKQEAYEAAQAKTFEENVELKAKLDDLQNKQIKLNGNTGKHDYVFKGYNTNDLTKNFKIQCSEEVQKEAADTMIKALTSSNTGAYAIPDEYGNSILGLAELQSVALNKAHIINMVNGNTMKLPAKGTRATVDAQAFGTANTASATTLAQLTFTVDKRVGSYESIYTDVILDANFDVIGDWVQPSIAESIGQMFDDEMFQGDEFTTTVYGAGTAAVTASGTTNIAAALTYANLVTTAYTVELERGLHPEWFLPRGAFKDIVALVSSTSGMPIFNPTPISGAPAGTLLGYPINIVPSIDNTPDDGAMRLCFGDPKKYIIALRGGLMFSVNDKVQEKEGITQFIGYARGDGNLVSANAFAYISRED